MEKTKKKIKSFGSSFTTNTESKRPDTGTHEVEEGADKWLISIRDQVNHGGGGFQAELDDAVDVRAVPLELIYINPNNARELEINPEEIRKHIGILKLPSEAFSDDDAWIDAYTEQVFTLFGSSKKADDCLNIALFAASIKTPQNLMAPICVWREETSFHLIAGERRYLAHLLMGATHALTRIWSEKPNPYDIQILEWQENNERVDLSVFENISSIRKIIEKWQAINPLEKMTSRKLAQIISTGRTSAARWLKVAKCSNKDLNDALKTRKINSIDLAHELASLNAPAIKAYLDRIDKGQSITGDSIKKEQRNPNNKKSTSLKARPALKLNTKANTQPVAFIVKTVVDKINQPELHSALQTLDFDKPQELSKALAITIEFIEEQEGNLL